MDHPCDSGSQHAIIIECSDSATGHLTSPSSACHLHRNAPLATEDRPSTSTEMQLSHASESSSSSSSPASSPFASPPASPGRRGDDHTQRQRPQRSCMWISLELVIYVGQIAGAIVVLSFSRHEHPKAPLFAWVVGYTAGCIATLPHLLWRYMHRHTLDSEHEATATSQYGIAEPLTRMTSSAMLGPDDRSQALRLGPILTVNCPRLSTVAYHFKMAIDCFFAVWFVVGNVWIFGGHSSSSDAPNLYRLCIVFLTFSCLGYAVPFVMFAMICCCFPCIISILRAREDAMRISGASAEAIDALPTYKFMSKRSKVKAAAAPEIPPSENPSDGGILGPGTKKERVVSAEDAVCCICLAMYADDDELRELPCSHWFHKQCVDKWLKINAVCPLCKAQIGNGGGGAAAAARSLVATMLFGSRRDHRRRAGRTGVLPAVPRVVMV